MRSGVAPRVVQGRVLPGGVAMSVSRAPGLVSITLTLMPGHPATIGTEGETAEIAFPEGVPVAAGDRVAIVIEKGTGGSAGYAGPVWIPVATTLDRAHVRY